MIIFFLSFFISFTIYLYTLCPTVAPYRDAGEMVTAIATLGIAHPPGYPLYILTGKFFTLLIPWGNTAYQLNLFSGFCAAMTVGLVGAIAKPELTLLGKKVGQTFSATKLRRISLRLKGCTTLSKAKALPYINLCREQASLFPTLLALLFAGYATFWYLALVSEMYTLNVFLAMLLIFLAYKYRNELNQKYLYLLFFVFGLASGNHLTILLLFPGIIYFIFPKQNYKTYFFSAVFLGLGLSIYLYLPLRSLQQPLLDWCDPQTWDRFWYVLTRKGYGSSLDLIAERYSLGQVIIPEFKVYLKNLFWAFTPVGFILGLVGLYFSFCRGRSSRFNSSGFPTSKETIFLLLLFIFSGPFFITRAKMPPNPHALAIMEPHYILPNLIFFFWVVIGIKMLYSRFPKTILFLLLPLPLFGFWHNYPGLTKRENYAARDWAVNVFASLPSNSAVVARKDIQIFSLWSLQFAEKKRPDLVLLAQGLSGSAWYQQQLKQRYPDLSLQKDLRNPDEFTDFAQNNLNRLSIFFTLDTEATENLDKNFVILPRGLVNQILAALPSSLPAVALAQAGLPSPTRVEGFNLLNSLYQYHYSIRSQDYPDFFTANLLEQYALAHHQLGVNYFNDKQSDRAEKELLAAISLNPQFSSSFIHLGYLYFQKELWEKAVWAYNQAIKDFNADYKKAIDYIAYPEITAAILKELAGAHNNLGAVYERQHKFEAALNEYKKALQCQPRHIDAWFNLAVLYWKEGNWDKVIETLKQLLTIAPEHQQARYYLALAMKNKEKAN